MSSLKSQLKTLSVGIEIEMYNIKNEEESVIAEGFIKTLKICFYKYMTVINRNIFIDN